MNQRDTFKRYQEQIATWIDSVGSQYFDPLTNGCMLSEEVGEVNRLLCREYGQQRYKQGEFHDNFNDALADELADVVFVVGCIANEQGIDLTQAIHRNMTKKSLRDANRYRNKQAG
jgi:NTP pyrophosphatase (non-canonical NTP hydrolase)